MSRTAAACLTQIDDDEKESKIRQEYNSVEEKLNSIQRQLE